MLLSIVVIVLREALEASILIALLLSISHFQQLNKSWFSLAIPIGLVSAVFYAYQLDTISEWFDYVGQEVVNASLQLFIYCFCVLICCIHFHRIKTFITLLPVLMILVLTLTISREGGELFIFYTGFVHSDANLFSVLTSSFVGLAIGISAGIIVFYSITLLSSQTARFASSILLILIAAGTVLQAVQLLIQADWLEGGAPLWNSDWLLSEQSILGQVAYAVFSYDSTPTHIEIISYCSAILLIAGLLSAWPFLKPKLISVEEQHD